MFSGPISTIRNRKNESNEGVSTDSQPQELKEISLENNHSDDGRLTPFASPAGLIPRPSSNALTQRSMNTFSTTPWGISSQQSILNSPKVLATSTPCKAKLLTTQSADSPSLMHRPKSISQRLTAKRDSPHQRSRYQKSYVPSKMHKRTLKRQQNMGYSRDHISRLLSMDEYRSLIVDSMDQPEDKKTENNVADTVIDLTEDDDNAIITNIKLRLQPNATDQVKT